ncbi:Error-prone DNA polymerase [Xylophilus ampelinus]|nr:Error-prone DNA polymerase [Xylophilus ampelinus]
MRAQPSTPVGMALIVGMREASARRIVEARKVAPFTNVEDLTRRAELDVHDLRCLSGADALRTSVGHRPNAVWEAVGVETKPGPLLRNAPTEEDAMEFAAPTEGADVAEDYASMGLTLRRHPLALLRPQLAKIGIRTAEELRQTARDKEQVRASGIVTHRQQPSTASGVIFATLEDETGTVPS